MSIKGHVNYGTAQELPKPITTKADGYVARRPLSAPLTPTGGKRVSPDEFYAWLLDFARRGARAPQFYELQSIANGIKRLTALRHEGRVRIYVGGHNWRVIEFMDEKIETARPSKDWQPYRMLTKDGDFFWRGNRWEAIR